MTKPLAFIACLIILTGCSNTTPPKFSQESNPERKKIGLPVIEDDWLMYESRNTEAVWKTPGSNTDSPNHFKKKVFFNTGQWISETDHYYSGKTGPSPDPDGGTQWEKVTVSYGFIPKPGYPKGWTCRYQSPTNWGEKVTLVEAEARLESWGLKRLNY